MKFSILLITTLLLANLAWAIEVDDSGAGNNVLQINFDNSYEKDTNQGYSDGTVASGNTVRLEKHKIKYLKGERIDDKDTGIFNSALVFDDPNAFVSDRSIAGLMSQCSNGLTVETWVAHDQTIDVATQNDIIYSIGPVNNFITLYQHYDNGPRYMLNVMGTSIMTPINSLVAKKDGKPNPQKVVVSVSATGEVGIYVSEEDSSNAKGYRLVPRGSTQVRVRAAEGENFGLVIGNNFNPNYSLAESNRENNTWRGRMYNLKVSCGYKNAEQVTGISGFARKLEGFAVSAGGEDSPSLRKAALMYARLVGMKAPLDHPVVKQMASLLDSGDRLGAARLATDVDGFYNVTVRDFAAGMSNREETINVPLNDFTATVIGIVKDDRNAQLFLTGDEIYYGPKNKAPVSSNMMSDILMSNRHYEELENINANLRNVLSPTKQMLSNGRGNAIINPEPAGLLTTRAFMSAHHVAGTGRRPVEFAFREFLCLPIDQIADTGRGDAHVMDNRIGRDIDRSPGGDPSKFETNCKSCHVPMDGFRGAFAYFSWKDGFVNYGPIVNDNDEFDGNSVATKFNENANTYAQGWRTVDNSFKNYAVGKKNMAQIGWESPSGNNKPSNLENLVAGGKGVGEFGRQLASTRAFPRCMAKRVYKQVCKRDPVQFEDAFIERMANEFVNSGYSMRTLFEHVAVSRECLGD
jgi:hypothetical protein